MRKKVFSSVGHGCFSRGMPVSVAMDISVCCDRHQCLWRWTLMSITSGINVPRRKHRYPANGMPARGFSGVFPRWFVCEDFAIALVLCQMAGFRSVFSDRQHIGTETGDSAAPENTVCQETAGGMGKKTFPCFSAGHSPLYGGKGGKTDLKEACKGTR